MKQKYFLLANDNEYPKPGGMLTLVAEHEDYKFIIHLKENFEKIYDYTKFEIERVTLSANNNIIDRKLLQ